MNMQPIVGAFPDGDWDFSRMFSSEDQLEFRPEFLAQYAFPAVDSSQFATHNSTLSSNPDEEMNMTGLEESLFCSWNALHSNLEFISQENSNSSNSSSRAFFPSFSNETYFFSNSNHIPTTNDSSMSMDICIMDEKNDGSFNHMYPQIAMTETASEDMGSDKKMNLDDQGQALGDAVSCKEQQLKRKLDVQESKANPSESTKKRARVTRANKGKKNVQSKKNQKAGADNNDEENNNGQSSSGFSSEDENASQDSNGGANSDSKALNSNGKTRASRGSATDPQSLYARKRRERINERLRILQNLVPNGTKVDISTMLEEAVHYVKFLQLQIKLLSSDDLWMYAPIAYNGVDIGLNQKFSTLL